MNTLRISFPGHDLQPKPPAPTAPAHINPDADLTVQSTIRDTQNSGLTLFRCSPAALHSAMRTTEPGDLLPQNPGRKWVNTSRASEEHRLNRSGRFCGPHNHYNRQNHYKPRQGKPSLTEPCCRPARIRQTACSGGFALNVQQN